MFGLIQLNAVDKFAMLEQLCGSIMSQILNSLPNTSRGFCSLHWGQSAVVAYATTYDLCGTNGTNYSEECYALFVRLAEDSPIAIHSDDTFMELLYMSHKLKVLCFIFSYLNRFTEKKGLRKCSEVADEYLRARICRMSDEVSNI
jgi:hypothetical protein